MNPLSINPLALLGAGAAALLIGFGSGWTTNGWRLHTELAELKTAHATEKAAQATGALTALKDDAKAVHDAATEFMSAQNTLGPKIDALKKEVKNASRLPPDCRPDPVRVHSLDAAIDAANTAAARR